MLTSRSLPVVLALFLVTCFVLMALSSWYSICPEGAKPRESVNPLIKWCERVNKEGVRVKEGPWRVFFERNILRERGEYWQGQPHGHWVYWYHNGNKKEEGDMHLGQRCGRWSFWNEEGDLLETVSYDKF